MPRSNAPHPYGSREVRRQRRYGPKPVDEAPKVPPEIVAKRRAANAAARKARRANRR